MSDSATAAVEGQPTEAPAAAPVPTPPATQQTQSVENLPTWAQDMIKGLRDEAASHRVKARDAADEGKRLAADEHTAKVSELEAAIAAEKTKAEVAALDSLKLRAVLEEGVPGERAAELADRVRGTTEDEIRGDAKRMKELLGITATPATDPTQGRGTNDGVLPLNGDPLTQAIKAKLGI